MQQPLDLWEGDAPYTRAGDAPFRPNLKPFPAQNARGAVIVIPGGGYAIKAEHEGAPIARALNSQGIAAYVLDYRVAPCHHAAPLSDANRAVRLVRSLGYEKVAVLGFSAGGHLCASAAVHFDAGNKCSDDPVERFSSRPDAFIPCYPVISMGKYTHLGSRKCLLGEQWEDEALAHFYSIEHQVKEDTPPAFLWHTANDYGVPVQNSLLLAHALADKHIPFEMHIYPKGPHGMGLATENLPVSDWITALCRWLLEMGFGR